ncbi:hypothetical protein PRZ48_000172 [Zasmidium cellare]|uniref:ABC transmembrane type-1 domain-containing protein n=1 Tax=Zasmidium cellare TaxID=395010 RepID=A0ABR0EZ01_ZASCE|nr:hypothetical protein PRZ48_000172 [Zasmidium cellare]
MSTIFADVTSGRLSEDDFVIVIGKIMLYFLYLAIGELVGSYAMWIGFTLGGQSICARMRLLVSVFHQGVSFLDKAGTVYVNTLLGADGDAVNDAISSKLGRVIAATSSVLVAFAVSFARSWLLTLILGSGVLALAVTAFVGTLFVSRFTKRSSAALAEATSVAEETISGIVCAMTNGAESILATRYKNNLSCRQDPFAFDDSADVARILTMN